MGFMRQSSSLQVIVSDGSSMGSSKAVERRTCPLNARVQACSGFVFQPRPYVRKFAAFGPKRSLCQVQASKLTLC